MPRDLTPKQPAKWWVWSWWWGAWREVPASEAAIYHCQGNSNRRRWGNIVTRKPVTLSETPPTWRPEQ